MRDVEAVMSKMARGARRGALLVGSLLVGAMMMAACTTSSEPPRGSAPPTGSASPSASPSASAPPASPPAEPSSAPSIPAPSTAPSTPPKGSITVRGVVRPGVEPGCTVLDTGGTVGYQLIGGDPALIRPGRSIEVVGSVRTGQATTCMQGALLEVHRVRPL